MSEKQPYTAARLALADSGESITYTHCRLTVVEGSDAGKVFESEKALIRVGTNTDNDVVLADPAVSRSHFELHKRGGDYSLVDVGSSNGTFVGPLEVKDVTLHNVSEILVGDSTLRFEPMSTEFEVAPSGANRVGELVGDTVAMREIFTIVERIAPTELPILITGETGTGKELVARAIHTRSARSSAPFVTLAVGSLPPALVESALFGHEPGAFDGADQPYAGAFERASGGTLFIDEVHELPEDLQRRLLRAMERGELQRMRGTDTIRADTRIVAAVPPSIRARVDDGSFRDDLYFRLAVIRLDLPPLRDRSQDIPVIVRDFFRRHESELTAMGASARHVDEAALARLNAYEYPGNVRELVNILHRAVAVAKGAAITVDDLPAEVLGGPAAAGAGSANAVVLPNASMRFKDAKAKVLDAFERQYLTDLISRHDGNISKAAREAGIDRRHLYRLLDKYGIETDRSDD